ncbi:TPA: restriction endonuclease subunit S [Vibrio vulnificus]|nr:restriction endonuclease subunit S [Vibrio vulnificus]HDY7862173.1 restriction endonuclease subunit S [Vibrio vulnificus]HDY7876404.1 restriction endonuclease subunit S [Vibrio vulnificus]
MSHKLAEVSSKSHAETGGNVIPTGYQQTDVGIIPVDWRCEEIAEFRPFVTSGSRGWAAYYSKYGSPFVRITNMMRTSIYLDLSDTKYVSLPENASEGSRTSLENGDVLVSITADIGISSYVDERLDKPAFINQHIALVRFNSLDIDSKFVAYYLSSEPVQNLFRSGSDQGAKAGMNLAGVRRIKIVVPSKKEQTAIANALSDVDALISELEKLIAKKQAIKTATMQQLLTGKKRLPQFAKNEDGTLKGYKESELGDIPEDWEVSTADRVCDVLTGFPFPSNNYSASGVRLLRGANVKRNCTDWSDEITEFWPELEAGIKSYELHEGDIVISMDGSLVGRSFAQLTRKDLPALLLQRVARLRGHSISQNYLKEWVCSKFFTEYCDSVKTVTAIPHISPKDIKEYKLAVPTSEVEQEEIAVVLSEMAAEIDVLQQRLIKTRHIKQGMMQELLTGKTRLVKPESK